MRDDGWEDDRIGPLGSEADARLAADAALALLGLVALALLVATLLA